MTLLLAVPLTDSSPDGECETASPKALQILMPTLKRQSDVRIVTSLRAGVCFRRQW
jgi:hypothetical protein